MKRLRRTHVFILFVVFIMIQLVIFFSSTLALWKNYDQKVEWISQVITMNTKEILLEYDFKSIPEMMNAFVELEEVSGIRVFDAVLNQAVEMGEKPEKGATKIVARQLFHNSCDLGTLEIYFTNRHITSTFYDMLVKLVLEACFLFMVFLFLFWFISKKYSKPIQDLSAIIKSFNQWNSMGRFLCVVILI